MLIPVQSFAPDAAPEAPGIVKDCLGYIPTERGMKAAPTAQVRSDALASACRGAAALTTLAGTTTTYAGTSSNLYSLSGSAWTSVGSGYSLSASDNWYFTVFGNDVLAGNYSTGLQRLSGGSFSAISGAPKAEIIEAVGLFVFAFNTNDAGWGGYTDGWWCCAQADVTSWTPSIASQSARGRFLDAPGAVTAAKALGSQMVVYKAGAIYVGTYQGPPKIWDWQMAPGNAGAVGKFAVARVTINGIPGLVSVGPDNLWLFDGSRPQPIGDGEVRRWFYSRLHPSYTSKTSIVNDPDRGLAYIMFANGSSDGRLNDCLVWSYKFGRWGRGRDYAATHSFQFARSADTFGTLGTGLTFGQLSAPTFDQLGNKGGVPGPAVSVADKMATLDGNAVNSYVETSMFGVDQQVSLVSRIRPRYSLPPLTSAIRLKSADSLGEVPLATSAIPLLSNKFDVLREARWFGIYHESQGECEVSGLDVVVEVVSDE